MQNTEEASAGGLEATTLNVADIGNTGGTETSPEAATQPTEEPQATEEPESIAEPTPEPTPEPVPTPEPTLEPTPEPVPTPVPTLEPTPEPTYTYTDMSATMYAKQSVNVRTLPNTDGEMVGSLSTNQEIVITGQCNETGWYRFEYNGQTAYVSNNYLSDTKMEAAQSPSISSGSASMSSEPCPYTLHEWTVETTEYGWNVYVIYTTASNWEGLRALGYNVPDDGRALNSDKYPQLSAEGYTFGYHYVAYFERVDTYAEGTVYKCSWGPHVTITTTAQDAGCPDFGKTNVCRPGTVRTID